MLSPGKKAKTVDGKSTGGRPKNERYGLEMRADLKRDLEQFAVDYHLEVATIIRSGAQLYTTGYLPVLGAIPCGPLAEAVAETHYYEVVPPYLKPRAELGDFLLEAQGDSMSPKIERGDLVMLRPGIEAANGDICAVQIYRDPESDKPEATLKRLYRDFENHRFLLKPINPEHEVIEVDWEKSRLEIVGVFRGQLATG